jgi:ATP-dependent helicase HrpB
MMCELRIDDVLPELRRVLARGPAAVLSAPPGSGKTTGVPLALLDEPWLGGCRILMLEPRRLAARAAASRMADLLGEAVGETVGYRTRFDSRVSERTRIEVLTEGILTRRLQRDPALKGVALVVFDEFHERSLQADLGLALCLDVMAGLRDDLRLLVMSATLDTQAVADLLQGAPVIEGRGELFPVEMRYLSRLPRDGIAATVAAGVRRALSEQPGDILAFLPGGAEIRATAAALAADGGVQVHPLYGDLPREAQDRAIRRDPDGRRRVVLATSIAETSLTIEGIGAVVDSGWSRLPRFDPNTALTRLVTLRASGAAVDQRAGRAGRLGPGVCYRLWTETVQKGLQPAIPPEIQGADLAPLALELALWGVDDAMALRWLDPPPAGAWSQARELLAGLGALDRRGHLTAMGTRMAGMPAHPRLARMMLLASEQGLGALACNLAALVSERDILRVGQGPRPVGIEGRLQALQVWRRRSQGSAGGVDSAACAQVERAAYQWRRLLDLAGDTNAVGTPGRLLANAYPDRVARRRPGSHSRYLLAGGQGARLPEGDTAGRHEYLVVARLDAGRSEGRIQLAAGIGLAELRETQAHRIRVSEATGWDPGSLAVLSRQETRLGALVLQDRPLAEPVPEAVRAGMLDGLRQMGLDALPWTEEARAWQARVLSLRHWRAQDGYPDLSGAALIDGVEDWLAPYLNGMSRREHLRRLDLAEILRARLDRAAQQRVEAGAPTHLRVPSGSRLKLRYTPAEPPVLAVRLQEMFGVAETPTVCWGEVPVLLHLLSPAHRPIQVTQDLHGFWERTYPEVKRELMGRYPKHHWPEDPWSASPTRRTKSRRR